MKKTRNWLVWTWLLVAAVAAFGAAPGDLRLIDAAKKSDAKAVRTLIAGRAAVNAADVDGSTALHWAVQRDNSEIVELLIAAGANARAVTRYNVTPLSLAC